MLYSTNLTAPLFGLRREIDRLFEDTFAGRGDRAGWTPTVNVRESTRELTFEFELPGVKSDQVEITAENGILTVKGERKEERKEGDESRYHIVERTYGMFTRSFALPQGVDESQISADTEDGVLRIHVPKAALPQPRRIQIQPGKTQHGEAQIAGGQSRTVGDGKRTGGSGSSQEKRPGEMAASGTRSDVSVNRRDEAR
jgi:HSP20 family protein